MTAMNETVTRSETAAAELVPGRVFALGGLVEIDERLSWAGRSASGLTPVNCYLIRAEQGSVLVDTGVGAHAGQVVGQLLSLLPEGSRLSVVLTRTEMDCPLLTTVSPACPCCSALREVTSRAAGFTTSTVIVLEPLQVLLPPEQLPDEGVPLIETLKVLLDGFAVAGAWTVHECVQLSVVTLLPHEVVPAVVPSVPPDRSAPLFVHPAGTVSAALTPLHVALASPPVLLLRMVTRTVND